ncbi:T6SS amidase immunity protein Tai4 family protein [Serratia rubidaea]|uniref:Uncharacterized protein n=1 Tax=Serratia rubidaea TaxID=61652 RepID=A0A448SLX2_SERRU|nr:T6SS amidase immunity protein Tai4 family protein [Serratia rubidaea]MBH1928753.1 hypothetical protein [Serratia rubidaea]MDC6118528.1 T6SS amidase immunity protein Tai4 family protein [Serratia rubidaea]MEB7587283.1 type VI secretion system amidase immunity protein Tai4 [Serratia rubidaea]VEI68719.1 Uncharacterised protein [Serratia rubidaea]
MDIKVNTLTLLTTTLLFSTSLFAENIKIENLPQNKIYDNWLISRCIGEFTDSESTRQDAFRSASAYLEFSQLPIEAFDSSEVLIHQYLKKKNSGSVPGSYNTLTCLSLPTSEQAQGIFKKYVAISK